MSHSAPRLRTALWRGLQRRCPRCGRGALYQRWVTMHERCAACDLRYLGNQGDLWAYVVAIDRALLILPLVGMLLLRYYRAYPIWFYAILAAALVVGFLWSWPHRLGVGLGIDYWVRCRWGDLASVDRASPSLD